MEKIAKQLSPSLITLNETALKLKQKPRVKNYTSFKRNRTDKLMGGVATLVKFEDKDNFVKLSEGCLDDEYLITRHTNFMQPLNIINIYGEQECRVTKAEAEEKWMRLLNEINSIQKRKEHLLIIGDMNKHIGNDELGVAGNHPKISSGGELIRGFLSSENFVCLNNSKLVTGGPFTRYDPSNPSKREKMSCLDLVLVSI